MSSAVFINIQFVIGILGSIITIVCFLPQGIKTFFTKDTSSLSKWFFIFALLSSFLWLTIGSMTIASPYILDKKGSDSITNAIASGIPPIITNVVTLIINSGILFLKIRNIMNGKKLNMSEYEYCSKIRKDIMKNL